MGLVTWKNKRTGAIVRAEFPLPVFPELVQPEDEDGNGLPHQAPADFAAEHTQILPELPKASDEGLASVAVTSTPGSPVAMPAGTPPATSSPPAERAITRGDLQTLLNLVSSTVEREADRVIEEITALKASLAAAPPAPPAPETTPAPSSGG